jgi:hypothetical protein
MMHQTEIEGYNLQELADKIGDLRYDALQILLSKIALKIKNDALKDRNRGRVKLAHELDEASKSIENSANNIEKAWVICEPFI